jgi:hypothetical protein
MKMARGIFEGAKLCLGAVTVSTLGMAWCGYGFFDKSFARLDLIKQSEKELVQYIAEPQGKSIDGILSSTYTNLETAEQVNPRYAEDIAQLQSDITALRGELSAMDSPGPGITGSVAGSIKDSIDFLINQDSGKYLDVTLFALNAFGCYANAGIVIKKAKQNRRENERAARDDAYRNLGHAYGENNAGRPEDNDAMINEAFGAAIRYARRNFAGHPAGPARNTDARDDDNNIWRNHDNDDGNQIGGN